MMDQNKKLYTKCDNCDKEIELYNNHYIYGYYTEDLKYYERYACCSIKCLEKITNGKQG